MNMSSPQFKNGILTVPEGSEEAHLLDGMIELLKKERNDFFKVNEKWLSVKEHGLPEEGKAVLVYHTDKVSYAKHFSNMQTAYWRNDSIVDGEIEAEWYSADSIITVTHWRELPEPPIK